VLGAFALVALAEASARWRCEPANVAVGEPFALVLELQHDPRSSALELVHGEPAFDESWVVLERRPARVSERGDGATTTVIEWSVASLEPGERDLAGPLAGVAFADEVTSIGVGAAHLAVAGVLAADEDAPRPLREFPEGFVKGVDSGASSALRWLWIGSAVLVAAALAVCLVRRRRSASTASAPTPLERLAALERAAKDGGAPEGCFALTRLLREAADRLASRPREGLTDQEWLAGLAAAHELPAGVQEDLAEVLERASRLKYAGEVPTPWALGELFAGARATLEALGSARTVAPAPGGRA